MTIISAVREYLEAYSGLEENSPVWVDSLGPVPTEYTINPLAGTRIIEEYIDGSSLREYAFAFQSVESTADNLERLANQGFYEAFADWLEEQTDSDDLPDLEEGMTATKIEALGWGYLFQQGDSDTGIYQIQCRLEYEQE